MTVLGYMGDYMAMDDDGISSTVMSVRDYLAMAKADRPAAVIYDYEYLSVWIVPGTMTE